jgi:hypothetical protein
MLVAIVGDEPIEQALERALGAPYAADSRARSLPSEAASI